MSVNIKSFPLVTNLTVTSPEFPSVIERTEDPPSWISITPVTESKVTLPEFVEVISTPVWPSTFATPALESERDVLAEETVALTEDEVPF